MKNLGNGTVVFDNRPSVLSFSAVVGKKEGDGPYGKYFDEVEEDAYFGQETWEKAESENLRRSVALTLKKGGFKAEDIDFSLSGDLLNQCTSSGYALRSLGIPFLGIYGACSTMAESMLLGSLILGGGGGKRVLCATSSNFCSAEKQFRTPLEYGGQRTPNAQWTVTGSGSVVLGSEGDGPFIDCVTCGKIVDMGIKDIGNMGAAMAPAFTDTIKNHFNATGRDFSYYDLVVSGDLGLIGKSIAEELFLRDKIDTLGKYNDCGALIFDKKTQDTHAGGSGCGCAASMLCGYILPEMRKGNLRRVLFAATGALMSPTSTMQGESIPSISHAISLEA